MQDRNQGTTSVTTLQGRGCLQQPLSCTFSKLGRVCGLQRRRGAFLVTFNSAVLTTVTLLPSQSTCSARAHTQCCSPFAPIWLEQGLGSNSGHSLASSTAPNGALHTLATRLLQQHLLNPMKRLHSRAGSALLTWHSQLTPRAQTFGLTLLCTAWGKLAVRPTPWRTKEDRLQLEGPVY